MEDSRPVYQLPEVINRQKVFPGIKDLPPHIRTNFRNAFIRPVVRDVFNSEQPWANPDLAMLQLMHDRVYSVYPARVRYNDAIFHPVRSSLHDMRWGHLISRSDSDITWCRSQPHWDRCGVCGSTPPRKCVPPEAVTNSRC